MCSTLSLTDVLTTRSIADYTELTAIHPELPPTLEALVQFMDATDLDGQSGRDACVRILVKHMQDPESDAQSVQVWLLWVLRQMTASIAANYTNRSRPYQEVIHDVIWCLLEALRRVNTTMPFILYNISRDTRKRLRRGYGLELGPEKQELLPQEHLPIDDLVEHGWDPQSPVDTTFLKDLQLPTEEEYMLAGQYIYGYSQAEIAEDLGISYSALKQRMHRLVLKIREMKK